MILRLPLPLAVPAAQRHVRVTGIVAAAVGERALAA